MKKEKLTLKLNKETIANLEKTELNDVQGGIPTTIFVTMKKTQCGYCVSYGYTHCLDCY